MEWKGNRIGFSLYGTSHAECVGVKAFGLPSFDLDLEEVRSFMQRRKASISAFSTARIEADEPIWVNGVEGNHLLGGNLEVKIENKNVRSGDYSNLYGIPRPSHADYAAYLMDGRLDFRGGGEFGGRMTAPLSVLGSICLQMLKKNYGIAVSAQLKSVGVVSAANGADAMLHEVEMAAAEGDSVGGVISCSISGVVGGLGAGKLGSIEGALSSLLYLIPAVKGVSFGAGFDISSMRGSEANDQMRYEDGKVVFLSNNAGGINGGLTNGAAITFSVAMRPTPSISKRQKTIDLTKKENADIEVKGRHDACVAYRAVPVVEAAAGIVMLDILLSAEKADGINGARAYIDALDTEISTLMAKRFDAVRKIGAAKKALGKAVKDSTREAAVIAHIREAGETEKEQDALENIYKTIMAESRKMEE